jgi:hypothetical protein
MIVFFPTYARRLPGERRWRATVAGMISRPLPPKSHRRILAIGVLKRLLELDEAQLQSEVFQRRADAFLFQRVAGERVRIMLGDRQIDAGQSDRVGHFQRSIELDEADIDALAMRTGSTTTGGDCRWLSYEAAIAADDNRSDGLPGPAVSAPGRIQVIDDEGMSVISDIDDTVKVTNVASRRELLANTLLREFYAVPGMAEVYQGWQEAGTAFHYVSASPWQLANCLSGFLRDAGLPSGSMHLKLFRLKDSTPLRRLPSRKRSKRRTIDGSFYSWAIRENATRRSTPKLPAGIPTAWLASPSGRWRARRRGRRFGRGSIGWPGGCPVAAGTCSPSRRNWPQSFPSGSRPWRQPPTAFFHAMSAKSLRFSLGRRRAFC